MTDRVSLNALIRHAFRGVRLEDGVGLNEAQGIDDHETDWWLAQRRSTDEKEDWLAIPPERLNDCNSSLSFFDAAGMRFHLPAYMIAENEGTYRFDLLVHLAKRPESNKQFNLFSSEQRAAVAAYLTHLRSQDDYVEEQAIIDRALTTYWASEGAA
jgi:hypothetical protein